MHRIINSFKTRKRSKVKFLEFALATVFFSSSTAFAGGYEKALMFSGRYSGIAGAASSSVEGSESLYWNPAGLTNNQSDRRHHFSVNLSPTFSSASGPLTSNNQSVDSEAANTLPLGVFYSYHRDKYSMGIGYYAAGGTNVEFNNKPFGATTADFTSKIRIPELSLGGSYALSDNLRLGVAYRLGMAEADYSTATRSSANPANGAIFRFNDFKDETHGFRLGLQYECDDWGLGFAYRSRMNYRLSGNGRRDVRALATGDAVPGFAASGNAQVSTEFPQALQLGGHYNFTARWRGFAEVWWTQYSKVQRLTFDSATVTGLDFATDWNDQWNLRLGGEYGDVKQWPLRFGYILTTPSTPEDLARATFSTPGLGHTLTTGTGYEFSEGYRFDAAYEYSFASADVSANAANNVFAGKYQTDAHVFHIGLNAEF